MATAMLLLKVEHKPAAQIDRCVSVSYGERERTVRVKQRTLDPKLAMAHSIVRVHNLLHTGARSRAMVSITLLYQQAVDAIAAMQYVHALLSTEFSKSEPKE